MQCTRAPREGGHISQPSPTDGPSKYSLYEVELIERWAQGSLQSLGTVDTKGVLVSTGNAGLLSVLCMIRSRQGQVRQGLSYSRGRGTAVQ